MDIINKPNIIFFAIIISAMMIFGASFFLFHSGIGKIYATVTGIDKNVTNCHIEPPFKCTYFSARENNDSSNTMMARISFINIGEKRLPYINISISGETINEPCMKSFLTTGVGTRPSKSYRNQFASGGFVSIPFTCNLNGLLPSSFNITIKYSENGQNFVIKGNSTI